MSADDLAWGQGISGHDIDLGYMEDLAAHVYDVAKCKWTIYSQISNISYTKSQNLNFSCLDLQLSLQSGVTVSRE